MSFIYVCAFAHISYVHVQCIASLAEHQQGNISRLRAEARAPTLNDYDMEVVVRGASDTVKQRRRIKQPAVQVLL